MNKQKLSLLQRRYELLAKIALQREQLAEFEKRWRAPVAAVDKGITVARFFRSRPILLTAAVALIAIRRRSLTGLLKNAGFLWKGVRYLAALSARFMFRG